jgi:hypothetical protein
LAWACLGLEWSPPSWCHLRLPGAWGSHRIPPLVGNATSGGPLVLCRLRAIHSPWRACRRRLARPRVAERRRAGHECVHAGLPDRPGGEGPAPTPPPERLVPVDRGHCRHGDLRPGGTRRVVRCGAWRDQTTAPPSTRKNGRRPFAPGFQGRRPLASRVFGFSMPEPPPAAPAPIPGIDPAPRRLGHPPRSGLGRARAPACTSS